MVDGKMKKVSLPCTGWFENVARCRRAPYPLGLHVIRCFTFYSHGTMTPFTKPVTWFLFFAWAQTVLRLPDVPFWFRPFENVEFIVQKIRELLTTERRIFLRLAFTCLCVIWVRCRAWPAAALSAFFPFFLLHFNVRFSIVRHLNYWACSALHLFVHSPKFKSVFGISLPRFVLCVCGFRSESVVLHGVVYRVLKRKDFLGMFREGRDKPTPPEILVQGQYNCADLVRGDFSNPWRFCVSRTYTGNNSETYAYALGLRILSPQIVMSMLKNWQKISRITPTSISISCGIIKTVRQTSCLSCSYLLDDKPTATSRMDVARASSAITVLPSNMKLVTECV